MARGRPTDLTPQLSKKIIEAIRAGNYIETAAAYAGVSKQSLYNWMKRGAREQRRIEENPRNRIRKSEKPFIDFMDAVEKAQAEAEARDVALIGKAAVENWQAAAWRLERKFPERWGRKDRVQAELTHSGEMTVNNPFENLTTEELREIAGLKEE